MKTWLLIEKRQLAHPLKFWFVISSTLWIENFRSKQTLQCFGMLLDTVTLKKVQNYKSSFFLQGISVRNKGTFSRRLFSRRLRVQKF